MRNLNSLQCIVTKEKTLEDVPAKANTGGSFQASRQRAFKKLYLTMASPNTLLLKLQFTPEINTLLYGVLKSTHFSIRATFKQTRSLCC